MIRKATTNIKDWFVISVCIMIFLVLDLWDFCRKEEKESQSIGELYEDYSY